ncbi:MAG: hypothetical protein JO046_05895 [Solirubrobacterales bacterium]|nr:hypothetical protein [Solirubrobacterales bacterium]
MTFPSSHSVTSDRSRPSRTGHQRLATALADREYPKIPLELRELSVDWADELQRDRDPLVRVDGQLKDGEELAARLGAQLIRAPAIPW